MRFRPIRGVILIFAFASGGCASQRVHILPEIAGISRIAVINLADSEGKISPESEFFTNEFVSVGFSVVERGHLQEVIKEAFTSTGYLDDRSVAQWGRGLGIEAVVLHRLLTNRLLMRSSDEYIANGWVRIVEVETGRILLTYNPEVRVSASSRARAAKMYAERVVDDIRSALKQQGYRIATGIKVKIDQRTSSTTTQTSP